ncbi:MAG: TldD/PmbA family protein [candidate division WS1 bacterium]|nr:TldD/PmbA family protein [candidate division WS1 bacterium]
MRNLIEDILEAARKAGVQFADLRIAEGSSLSISVQDGLTERVSTGSGRSAGLRVLVDGAWGFAPTSDVSKAELLRCVEEAVAMARLAAPSVSDPGRVAEVPAVVDSVAAEFRIDPRGVALKERVQAVYAMEQRARAEDKTRIVNTVARYGDGRGKLYLGSTNGTYLEQESVRCLAALSVVAQEGNVRQWASESRANGRGYEVFAELDPEAFAGQTARRALDLLQAAPPPAGKLEAVVDPKITGLLVHEAFGHNCEADLVWAGESIVSDKLGQPVASPLITIMDDPTLEGRNGSYRYDSEGTPAQAHPLVVDGILQGFMHSLETAARLEATPNGAARAGGAMDPPQVRMSNTFIAPGTTSLAEMIADIEHGIYLTGGKWGYVATERGQFTCNAEQGFEICQGKIGRRYRNVSFSGLTLETLRQVTAVGADLEFEMGGMCGKGGQGVPVDTGGPHMRIAELVIGGQEEPAP